MNVLGLRDLQSFGLMPIQKAFLVFNLNSLVFQQDGQTTKSIRTQPKSFGANPNINANFEFKVVLPNEKLFCPSLAVVAYDYIFRGISQPTIGTFSIPVGEIMHETLERRASHLKRCKTVEALLQMSLNQECSLDANGLKTKIKSLKLEQRAQFSIDVNEKGEIIDHEEIKYERKTRDEFDEVRA